MTRGTTPIYESPANISKNVDRSMIAGIAKQFPIENRDFKLTVANVHVDKKAFDHRDEKNAILKSKSLTYPIKGDLQLIDKATNKVVDSEKNFPLADSFHVTGKHTVMYKGNNYSVANLVLLKPGVYSRAKDDGTFEAQFNTGSGQSFSITLNPKNQLFYIDVKGTKSLLGPVLTDIFSMGRDSVERYVPSEIWSKNSQAAATDKKTINSLYLKMVPRKDQNAEASKEEKIQALRLSLESTKLDPSTTKITLGASHTNVSGNVIVKAISNLVKVYKGEREEDNRDSLQFKRVQNLSDFIERRFNSERSHETVSKATNKLTFNLERIKKENPKIKSAIHVKPYTKIFTDFILRSPLSSAPTETNPIESLESVGKLTIVGPGEGGVKDDKSIPDGARNIDPSHLGIIDPSRTPESASVGVDQRFTVNARRDKEGNMYARVIDNSGKQHYLTSVEMMQNTVGFPGEKEKKGRSVHAQDKGKIKMVPRSKVKYWLADAADMYTITTNLVPFLNSNHPGRLTMAGKAIPQALSLQNREAPIVQTLDENHKPFVDALGHHISTISPTSGIVSKITNKYMAIKDKDGKLHTEHFVKSLPFNNKGFLDDSPTGLKVGDKVKKGQILSDNNYTKDGKLALGLNLYSAYLPWKGFNHEDGLVISRSAAKSLNSLHSYKYDYVMRADTVANKEIFKRYSSGKLTPDQLKKLDKRGFVIKGTRLEHGDAVFAVLEKREVTPEDKVLGNLNKILVNPYRLVVKYWEHDEPGEIVDVHTETKNVRILARSVKPLEIGDKLTGLHGNKGVISKVIEDHDMPISETTGKAVDILLNPASVTSRINFGQVMETVAGKIADKKGSPYMVKNYENKSNIKALMSELKELGLSDTDTIVDPTTGKALGKALAGPQYFLKLYKTTDSNYSARSVGGYDAYSQPTKGGERSAKSVGYMEFLGLLGSNARKNLKEIGTIKSEENSDFWDSFIGGRPLPKPKQTFASKRFFDYLKASGVNVKNKDGVLQATPMTDHDILQMSNGVIKTPKLLSSKNLEPEKGGLFDIGITGGLKGEKWSHYELAEPMVNPMFETPLKSILGLNKKEFDGIVSGAMGVNKHGKGHYSIIDTATDTTVRTIGSGLLKKAADDTEKEPLVSGAAFEAMLEDIDVDKELKESVTGSLEATAVSRRNAYIKKAKFLKGSLNTGVHPKDAYVLRNIPVLPPNMRPVINKGGNQLEYADINSFYKDHMLVDSPTSKLINEISPEYLTQERAGMYKALKATLGMGDAISGSVRGKDLKGILKQISGTKGPKTGMFQDKILKKKQDFSGRGTIYAAPDVGFNEIKYPKEGLWEMYRFHIERYLSRLGYSRPEAKKAYESRNTAAQSAFNAVIKDVPVIVNRAPTLMRTNLMAMFPVPVDGKTIGLNPLHLPGFAADYDGDAMSTFVPMTPEAVDEAKKKMMPTNHLSDARKGYGYAMFAPGHEAILGSVHLTEPNKDQKTVEFKTEGAAIKALKKGTIDVNTPIKITGKK